MAVMLVSIFAFANSFYILAKNQMDYDDIPEGEAPQYNTFLGSMEHVFLLSLGEFNLDDYSLGSGN